MRISQQKKDKICEQILALLFQHFPKPIFTSTISQEIARDEEFVKSLLTIMASKDMITLVNKNKHGSKYKKRQRWRLSTKAYEIYSQKVSFKH